MPRKLRREVRQLRFKFCRRSFASISYGLDESLALPGFEGQNANRNVLQDRTHIALELTGRARVEIPLLNLVGIVKHSVIYIFEVVRFLADVVDRFNSYRATPQQTSR